MCGRVRWRWPALLITGLGVAQMCAAAPAAEYHVKAAFIYKFATYIRWPVSSGGAPTAPFLIGILGENPFGSSLEEVARDRTVYGRRIRIKRLRRIEDALQCDLVFVSASEQANLTKIFDLLRGAPVLTVGDLDRFAEQGGMIGLVTTEDDRIRFDINKGALERAGLRASSQLLQLARIVDETRRDRGPR